MAGSCRLLLAAALLGAAHPAVALQHFMSVREVYVGPADQPAAQYVLLQMYQHFQNQVAGHAVDVYDAGGALVASYVFPQHVPVPLNQSYILIATAEAEARFGVTADLVMTPDLPRAGGKVCFANFDCLSWGGYAGDRDNPSPTGVPFNTGGGLAPGCAVHRDISAGDPALLEPTDDTNDSAADFDFTEQAHPVNNLGSAGTDPGPACAAGKSIFLDAAGAVAGVTLLALLAGLFFRRAAAA